MAEIEIKIKLSSGKKISLSQGEYDELKTAMDTEATVSLPVDNYRPWAGWPYDTWGDPTITCDSVATHLDSWLRHNCH